MEVGDKRDDVRNRELRIFLGNVTVKTLPLRNTLEVNVI